MLTLLSLLGCDQPVESAAEPRSVTFLHINDTYRIEGVPTGGGMPRVRQLRKTLEVVDDELIFTHGGDLLSPSMLSRMFAGEQMIDVLSHLDGSDDFDARMFVVPGNHEFDGSKCKHAPIVQQRIAESQFTWLSANINFQDCTLGDATVPAIAADNLVPHTIIEANGLRIGMFGLTIGSKHPEFVDSFDDALETARLKTAELRALTGADAVDLVVALTHLSLSTDQSILRELGASGPDLLLGGHEHIRQAEEEDGRWVLKADAEALSAIVAKVTVGPDGITTTHEVVPLTGATDPTLNTRVEGWLKRFDEQACDDLGEAPGCMLDPLTTATVNVVAEEMQIRRYETNVGDWVADLMLDDMADQGAQLAFINAGALRINLDVPAGSALSRTFVEELLPYEEDTHLIKITGAELKQILAYAGTEWKGQGRWLQVAGIAFTFTPNEAEDGGEVSNLTLLTDSGPRLIADDETLKAVTIAYMLRDGHKGPVLGPDKNIDLTGTNLKDLVLADLRARETFDVTIDGRICNPTQDGELPCQALGAE